MFDDLKSALTRSGPGLARDAAGAVSLAILFYAGLHLPHLF